MLARYSAAKIESTSKRARFMGTSAEIHIGIGHLPQALLFQVFIWGLRDREDFCNIRRTCAALAIASSRSRRFCIVMRELYPSKRLVMRDNGPVRGRYIDRARIEKGLHHYYPSVIKYVMDPKVCNWQRVGTTLMFDRHVVEVIFECTGCKINYEKLVEAIRCKSWLMWCTIAGPCVPFDARVLIKTRCTTLLGLTCNIDGEYQRVRLREQPGQ